MRSPDRTSGSPRGSLSRVGGSTIGSPGQYSISVRVDWRGSVGRSQEWEIEQGGGGLLESGGLD